MIYLYTSIFKHRLEAYCFKRLIFHNLIHNHTVNLLLNTTNHYIRISQTNINKITRKGFEMKKITYSPTYNGIPILTDESRKQGCYEEILQRTKSLMDNAIIKHNKVFFMRLDLRFPRNMTHSSDNSYIVNFINSYITNLTRQQLDPKYIWVREQSREKHQHYHLILLLNGNKTKSIYGHVQKAEELWGKQFSLSAGNNGLVNSCTKSRNGEQQQNGTMIKRNSEDFQTAYYKAFERSSYLAKKHTKQSLPGIRTWGSSKL